MNVTNLSEPTNYSMSECRENQLFNTAFDNPLNASRHLFVLLTSENYPYVMGEQEIDLCRLDF